MKSFTKFFADEYLILEDIESFMRELGNSFSFIGSEYKIKINTY